ncbi:UNKNOWN [Stylonychia lemnae]|uniref:Uncharacterized protein n=1 Tax=Stylonychia lemnae TaxID=5949 RepID=A0A078ATP4_STYLE|nr:UNKNOWN [Stylonychia lemnae]|eukprot:CDW84592.1 UNKNOWN [Stylonychia lemnae]
MSISPYQQSQIYLTLSENKRTLARVAQPKINSYNLRTKDSSRLDDLVSDEILDQQMSTDMINNINKKKSSSIQIPRLKLGNKSQSIQDQKESVYMTECDNAYQSKLVLPYKNNEVILKPLNKDEKTEEQVRVRDKNFETVVNDLNKISYDAESAIQKAYDSLSYMKADKQSMNTNDRLFQKGILFRSKIKHINNQIDEVLSKRIASTILENQAQDNKFDMSKFLNSPKEARKRKITNDFMNSDDLFNSGAITSQRNSQKQKRKVSEYIDEYMTSENKNDKKSLYSLTKKELEKAQKKIKQLSQNENSQVQQKKKVRKVQVKTEINQVYIVDQIKEEDFSRNHKQMYLNNKKNLPPSNIPSQQNPYSYI